MSTTALRIELLIIGFQASIWVILLFAGFESSIEFYKSNSNEIKETAGVIVLITLAWCYSLGAMVDGITAIFEDPKSLLRSNSGENKDSSSEKDKDSSSEKIKIHLQKKIKIHLQKKIKIHLQKKIKIHLQKKIMIHLL